ncbi:unnamed protein product [Owenia fusiformis]|uniref:Guanylate cyclase n=1 Tax=Owenia fusiformis TaxID=6347 RepID=A0A8J1T5P8_OWEFU|nr:unnamed protein product [Owenia fusiformis]
MYLLIASLFVFFGQSLSLQVTICSLVVKGTTLPYDYSKTGVAIAMGIEDARVNLGGSLTLNYIRRDIGDSCSQTAAVGAILAEAYLMENASIFIGPACPVMLERVWRMTEYWNVPVITPGELPQSLPYDGLKLSPNIIQMSYTADTVVGFLLSIFNKYGWKQVALVYDADSAYCSKLAATLDEMVNGTSYTVTKISTTTSNFDQIFGKVEKASKVVSVCLSEPDVIEMIREAEVKEMTNGHFAFFLLDDHDQPFLTNLLTVQSIQEALRAAYLITMQRPAIDQDFIDFKSRLKDRSAQEGYVYGSTEEVSEYAELWYDSVTLYAHTIQGMVSRGEDILNRVSVVSHMSDTTFKGLRGNVTMNTHGVREEDLELYSIDSSFNMQLVATFDGSERSYIEVSEISWLGGVQPSDGPSCQFENCGETESISFIVIIVCVCCAVAAAIAIAGFLYYRRQNDDDWWRVTWDELRIKTVRTLSSRTVATSQGSRLSKASVGAASMQQLFTQVGVLKGNQVAVRSVPLHPMVKLHVDDGLRQQLRELREITHPNLARVVGVVIEPPTVAVLTAYCPKGSLQDVLQNDAMQLDWSFRISIVQDIIKGMIYLHDSTLKSHGKLRSSKCVIDSRFVLKITDYGLPTIRGAEYHDETSVYWNAFLWTAPEHLRGSTSLLGSQEGDVYSFAIILQEIVTKTGPYEHMPETISTEEIVSRIRVGEQPPYRPYVDKSEYECADVIYELMQDSWDEEPKNRPSFQKIKRIMTKAGSWRETDNLMDTLLKRMEQYATNLENMVEEKTQAFIEEKKRSEQLLYQVLPKSVADKLKNNQTVESEAYECVTIYFSDIVGFTTISSESTPMQVVGLLNDLYTCFDAVLENFDVYKVETIGDAYMVVSGLPMRNGNNHVREIARMSLTLLHKITIFKVHHRPEEVLKLRIGLHSGPVCAGVVGLKMPRYCLFGDTVNTASRMESNGQAMKIHISSVSKNLLDKFKGFEIDLRGDITVKGKGEMTTYWLTGESNVDFSDTQQFFGQRKSKIEKESVVEPPMYVNAENDVNGSQTHVPDATPEVKDKEASDELLTPEIPVLQTTAPTPTIDKDDVYDI